MSNCIQAVHIKLQIYFHVIFLLGQLSFSAAETFIGDIMMLSSDVCVTSLSAAVD